MDSIYQIFGEGKDLTTLQMCARSFAMFFITLVLIRLGGVRMFGKKSAFDDIIVIMLGAVLSRGVVGASSFWSTVAAATVMIIIHRALAFACIKSKRIEQVLKGRPMFLYKNGRIDYDNLKRTSLSESDLHESLRLETQKDDFDDIDTAYIENNGRISFILKKKSTH
jgi:uncharacterized membrane protein YcaP (DUF421 family)